MNGFDLSTATDIRLGGGLVNDVYIGNQSIWHRSLDQRYLTFEAIQDTTFSFSRNDIQYSTNGGTSWTTLTAGTSTPTITAGNKIMWKASSLPIDSGWGIGTFSSTGSFRASGNVMSLVDGDNFSNSLTLVNNYQFRNLFTHNTNLYDAVNMILPATTLTEQCYCFMFCECTGLVAGPYQLPATTLAPNCYKDMFKNCSSLIVAPLELPATTLANYCYIEMYYGCTSLTLAPELPAPSLGYTSCYKNMFYGCSSLNNVTCLATNLGYSNSLNNWLYGVASSGTFFKDANTTWTTGTSGIPSGWTVYDY